VYGDFHHLESIPELRGIELDGFLFANSLHFAPDAELVLADAAGLLRPGGRVVVVEYADRPPSRWVPHPLPLTRLQTLASRAGLELPVVVGRHPSAFGGDVYCAVG
jgi:SAM-dependent methyltransferase